MKGSDLYRFSIANLIMSLLLIGILGIMLFHSFDSYFHLFNRIILFILLYILIGMRVKKITLDSTTLAVNYILIPFLKRSFKIEDISIIQLITPTMAKGGYNMVVQTKNNGSSKIEIVMFLNRAETFNTMENVLTSIGIKVERVN